MTLALVPIPAGKVAEAYDHIHPYLFAISKRTQDDIAEMQVALMSGETQAFLIWDAEKKKTQAFIGVNYKIRGGRRVGDVIWLTGEDRKSWVHLFADLQTYLKDFEKCVAIRAIAREGWKPILKNNGFRLTHLVMEKEI